MSEYNRGKVPCISATPIEDINLSSGTTTSGGRVNSETRPRQRESPLHLMAQANAASDEGPRPSQDGEDEPNVTSPQGRVHSDVARGGTMPEGIVPEPQVHPYLQYAGRSSRNSPEPAQTDQEGHYVGPASGVSFLSRALKKLRETSHSASTSQQTSIFNFADAPVPQYDPYFLILPRQEEAEALIHRYFDFASPTHRYLHQPTVDKWLVEFYDSVQNPRTLAPGAHERRAIILAVLAVAKQYSSYQDPTSYNTVNSAAFFAASEHHLLLESGGIRLTSIQARLVQCFCLLSQSRVNAAWSLFGTLANLILAIGLHRRKKRDGSVEIDLIEHECRKRVFWSAYTLDSYLSVGLGRPRSFHEEDLDQELPLCVDDWQITPTKILPRHEAGQSLTQASIYHAKLLKIISGILRDLYGIKRLPHEKQEEAMKLYDARLFQWRDELGAFLDITNTEIMMPIFRRQHTVLHLAYSHAIILLHRQALLMKPPASTVHQENAAQTGSQYSVRRCLDAATTIVIKLRDLVEKKQMYSAFWFTHYYVFSALVALYLYVVQSRSKPTHTWKPYLDLAQQGLRDLAACSTDMTYAQRYVVVLTELQTEAMKPTEEENRLTVPTNGVQSLYGHPPAASGHVSDVGLGAQAMASVAAGDGIVSSQDMHAIAAEFDVHVPQEPNFAGQHDTYDSTGVPLTLQDLENQETFGNLSIEGLADLAFMFSSENTNAFQAGDGMM